MFRIGFGIKWMLGTSIILIYIIIFYIFVISTHNFIYCVIGIFSSWAQLQPLSTHSLWIQILGWSWFSLCKSGIDIPHNSGHLESSMVVPCYFSLLFQLPILLVIFSYHCEKHMNKNQLWEEKFYLDPQFEGIAHYGANGIETRVGDAATETSTVRKQREKNA